MGLDLFAQTPYLLGVGAVALMAVGAAALACSASVIASSYFVWLNTLHLLKQNDKLTRRVIAFSENQPARELVGYEAMADAGQAQVQAQAMLMNRLSAMREAEGPQAEDYGNMAS